MITNITYPEVERYLQELGASEDPVLQEMEQVARERDFPIIGPMVGRLCWLLASTVKARDVFEIGSGFGYSTWFFASAVGESGRVVHTEKSAERSAEARRWLSKAGLAQRVVFEVGDALKVVTRYPGPFDVVFIDCDKEAYPQALELARARVRPGGVIIADNVLWSGRVAQGDHSAETTGILQYTKEALKAPELVTSIIPLRDGVAVSVKLESPTNPFRRKRTIPPSTKKRTT